MHAVETPFSICQVGIARCDITPPVGMYHRMWGAATHDRSTGIHRPLLATVLVFRSAAGTGPESESILLALDHCLFWNHEMNALLSVLEHESGLSRRQIHVCFSHTHGAGLLESSRAQLPGGDLIEPYLKELGRRLSQLLQQAREHVEKATITYGAGRCRLARHRDFWDEASNQYVCGFNPSGSADDTVLVARISRGDDTILATMVNYACHPTTLAWENTLVSPDYIGALREVVERGTAGAPCVFLQGASGDLGPLEGYVGDPAVADRNGRQLGYATLEALEALPPALTRFIYTGPVVSGATLGSWAHQALMEGEADEKSVWRYHHWTIDLPYRPDLPIKEQEEESKLHWQAEEQKAHEAGDEAKARDAHAMVERAVRNLSRLRNLPPGEQFPFPITVWQMGDGYWVTVEGEHYQILQRRVRERFPGVPIVIMTTVNGCRPAYLPPSHIYGKGIYQERVALLAPGTAERVIDAVIEHIEGWTERR